jgi:hypothetical protein
MPNIEARALGRLMLLGDVLDSDLETAIGGYFILFLGLGALLIVIGSRISFGTLQSQDAIVYSVASIFSVGGGVNLLNPLVIKLSTRGFTFARLRRKSWLCETHRDSKSPWSRFPELCSVLILSIILEVIWSP